MIRLKDNMSKWFLAAAFTLGSTTVYGAHADMRAPKKYHKGVAPAPSSPYPTSPSTGSSPKSGEPKA